MRRILCLYLPNWPIRRLCVADRGLDPRRPILLHAQDARCGQIVSACNAAAQERGARCAMPLAEATALAGQSRGCRILPADEAADLAALAKLAEHCDRFSPLVGWTTVGAEKTLRSLGDCVASPDWLYLDVAGIGVLFGGEQLLANAVSNELAQLGYIAWVAVADTVGAAWAVASLREAAPGVVLPPGQVEHATRDLPLSTLRLPLHTIELLGQLGIVQLEQLLKLPRTSLAARFGELLPLRLDQLLGTAEEAIVAHRPPPAFAAERVLEYPTESRELLERIVSELIECVATDLARRQQGVVQFLCRLDCMSSRPVLLHVGLFRPSADSRHLWNLTRMQLEQATLLGPVGRVNLSVVQSAPLEDRQRQLFESNRQDAERQLALLVDRLSSRLGAEAVLLPELTADPAPERAVRYAPRIAVQKRQATNKVKVPAAGSRPLILRTPPLAVKVIAIAPEGPPASFWFDGQRRGITRTWGPERIESGWWRGRSVRRDYYRVQTEQGQRYWLFRRLVDGKWFLHGEFA